MCKQMNIEELVKAQAIKIQELEIELKNCRAELENYKKRCDQYAQAYDSLLLQVKELQRNRFGKKSERFVDPEIPPSDLPADTLPDAMDDDTPDDEIDIPAHIRKKKKKINKEVPRRIEIIPLSDADKICSCGACKNIIRYETKEMLHYQAAVFEIVEQRREVAACPKGCDGSITTAPAPLQILPKIKATEELLSFLVVSKLDDRQPLYHLEKQLRERYGVDCSRQSMANWMIALMAPLQPIFNLMKDEVIDYDVASIDATTLQVLNEPGRKAETKSYMYCIRGGTPKKSVILYEYNHKEHKQFVRDWLEGFSGYLHADADNFFELAGETIATMVNCNAHARRKFEPIAKNAKGSGLAKEALRFYKELYKIEREAKTKNLSSDQRYELRQQKSKPLMDKFKVWMDEKFPTVLPKSPLGLAMTYCLKIWPGLARFLDDGRLEIDNNLTEQEIKPIVIARKNFIFCYSVEGADALCMHFSFIRTAKLYGLDPYDYYVKLLKSVPHCKTVEDYEKLLPWNIKLDYDKNN